MSLPTETVTSAASGLVFENWYSDGVTEAYRQAILTAERDFQAHFTDPVKVAMSFDLKPMDLAFSAGNTYANCDGSTTPPAMNVLDFNCFLNRFSAGCP